MTHIRYISNAIYTLAENYAAGRCSIRGHSLTKTNF